jgi:hypothetical protein
MIRRFELGIDRLVSRGEKRTTFVCSGGEHNGGDLRDDVAGKE